MGNYLFFYYLPTIVDVNGLRWVSHAVFLNIIMNHNSWVWLFKLGDCISHSFSLFAFRHFHFDLFIEVFEYSGVLEAFGVIEGSQLHYVSFAGSVESFDDQWDLFSNVITCFEHLKVSCILHISLFMLSSMTFSY